MSAIRYVVSWGVVICVTVVLTGCGAGQAKVYPVKGKITFEGKPMAGGGSIAFVPTSKDQEGKTAGGEIKPDGTYVLTTHKPDDGCMAGEFRVVITQVTDKEPPPTKDGEAPAAAITVVAEADRISPPYSDSKKSPLTTKVEAKASNELNFDLPRIAPEPPRFGAG